MYHYVLAWLWEKGEEKVVKLCLSNRPTEYILTETTYTRENFMEKVHLKNVTATHALMLKLNNPTHIHT